VREEVSGTPVPLSGAFWVAVEVGVLPVVTAARVVLDCLRLTVGLGFDVLVEFVVLGKLP
jgi:hypothetical protein